MATHVIYVTRRIWEDVRQLLEAAGIVIIWDEERPVPRQELLAQIGEADGLFCTGDDPIDAEVIARGTHLRVISTMSVGYNHIDIAAAAARGIIVCHTPGAADDAVADMTLALLLACARHISDADAFVKQRHWQYWSPELFLGADVQGSTLGVVGLGYVGLKVAQRALGFGMRVLYTDRQRNEDAEQHFGLQFGGLENLLREADFVSLHVPLTDATYHLLNDARLRMMKPTAYLLNMARGPVVEHGALVRALREGWIAGAGLDVFDEEPLPADDPLLTLPNVILTPHLGANTRKGIGRMMRTAARQIVQVLDGKRPSHPVLPPDEQQRAA